MLIMRLTQNLVLILINSNYTLLRDTRNRFNTTALPSGVTALIFLEQPRKCCSCLGTNAGKAIKINGAILVFPSYVANKPLKWFTFKKRRRTESNQNQIDVESLDNYHVHSIVIDGATQAQQVASWEAVS